MCLSYLLDSFFNLELLEAASICHHRVVTIEDNRNLFERRSTSLGEQEENTQALDDENDNVNKVKLPVQCLETDGVHVSAARSALQNPSM